jgi:DNA repair exonuclease SbcCD nuclease subunit
MSKYVFCTDLHLRADIPRCRAETIEEWYLHQKTRLETICKIAHAYGGKVVIAGDIFHKPNVPLEVMHLFISTMKDNKIVPYIMAGNHDLHYTNHDATDTSFNILSHIYPSWDCASGIGTTCYIPYGFGIENTIGNGSIVGMHTLTFEKDTDVPFGVKKFETAATLAEQAKKIGATCVVVGDMHRPFTAKIDGIRIINCGSMTVQSINEASNAHGVWTYDDSTDAVEFVPFTDTCMVVDDAYITEAKERDTRITAFVESMKDYEASSLDYLDNLKKALTHEEVSTTMKQVVNTWIN